LSPARSREAVTGLALAVAVFLLYVSTYSSVPTADGDTYLSWIDGGDFKGILNATSALTGYGFFSLKRALTWLGAPVRTLMLIQIVNALVAGAGVAVFYKTLRILGADRVLGVLGAALLATSFGYWYFANGEFQHVSLLVLLFIFDRLVRERASAGAPSVRWVVVLAVLNAFAVLFRQENFLFGFAAVAFLMVGRPWREGLKNGVLYAAVGSVTTGILVFLVGHFLLGLSTLEGFARWYLWLAEYVQHPQDYQAFEARLAFDLPRVVKGQLTAVTVGTQVVADALLRRAHMTQAKVLALLALTIVAYALMIMLVTDLWRARRRLRESRLSAVAVACIVWIFAYKLVVHGWWWPSVTKYQVVTVPPLVVLLTLGAVVMQADAAAARRVSVRMWPIAALLVVLFTVNAWGGIVPWYRYGRMKDAIVMRQSRDFGHDDLFISSESGLDAVFQRGPNHLEVKNVFLRLSEKEAFRSVETTIAEELSQHRRVYVYNFVPSPFTLIGINQAAVRGSEHLEAADFERFFARLQADYTLRSVFSYWEETKAPMYLFGERLEPFWEVTPRR
jgi:hypothetical protein